MEEKLKRNEDLSEIMHLIRVLKHKAVCFGNEPDKQLIFEMEEINDDIYNKLLIYLDM